MYGDGHEIKRSDVSVDLWLDRRLPFEPTGDVRRVRDEAREAIRGLRPPLGSMLSATYSSVDKSFCDVENVLMYNMGPSTFAGASQRGIRLIRNWTSAAVSPSGRLFAHHHRYCFTDLPKKPVGADVTEFSFELASLSSSTKLHHVWWSAASAKPTKAGAPIKGRFALHIELGTRIPLQNVANVVKPLVDGLVCALHADTLVDDEAVSRLSRVSAWEAAEISQRLATPQNPLLGPRRLLSRYRDFVKWDPADDLCDDCTVLVAPATRLACTVVVRPLASFHRPGDRSKP